MGEHFIGTAGWNIPRVHRDRFPVAGSQLQRYAIRLNAAEINTSFYRPHQATTYQRWAASVPPPFRFAVKMPKAITHDRALTRARDLLARFLGEIAGLGETLGPLLVQLPPAFAFDSRRVGRFFDLLRSVHLGPVVCEPRHPTWTSAAAVRMLVRFEIARVAADPPRAAGLSEPASGRASSITACTERRGRISRPIQPSGLRTSPCVSERVTHRYGVSSTIPVLDRPPETRSTSPLSSAGRIQDCERNVPFCNGWRLRSLERLDFYGDRRFRRTERRLRMRPHR